MGRETVVVLLFSTWTTSTVYNEPKKEPKSMAEHIKRILVTGPFMRKILLPVFSSFRFLKNSRRIRQPYPPLPKVRHPDINE